MAKRNTRGGLVPGCFILPPLQFAVYPFADVIRDYICRNGQNEAWYSVHGLHLLPMYRDGVGRQKQDNIIRHFLQGVGMNSSGYLNELIIYEQIMTNLRKRKKLAMQGSMKIQNQRNYYADLPG